MRTVIAIAIALLCACHKGDDYKVIEPTHVDAAVSCGLVTCESLHATCGPYGDGCGGTYACGDCPTPGDVCGGGGAFTCGPSACVPHGCDGATCGAVSDGCGRLTASCGTCTADGETCGGGGIANTCGKPACTGLCLQQQACAGPTATRITGTVTAPGHDDTATWGSPDPIYGATVYIPNGAEGPPAYGVTAFAPGVACETCAGIASGSPLVVATTGVDGTFAIDNAPCGDDIPLVIQLDRWRRQITIPHVACCATTALAGTQTHLPRTRTGEPGDLRSDIPLMAVNTGEADPLHCVLRKIGVADSEFTDPSGAGRVRMYRDNGASIDAATPAAAKLYGTPSELAKYDMTLFECVGDREEKAAADQQRVIDYANAGGRVFASHFSYVWLTDSDGTSAATNTGPKPFSQTASWLVDQNDADTLVATVDVTLQNDAATQARRIAFAQWLKVAGATATPGKIAIEQARNDLTAVSPVIATAAHTPAQRWLSTTAPFAAPLHYTFDTPVSYAGALPAKRCGRVLFSDFHVADAAAGSDTFPAECTAAPLTPQEKTLEFMLFDLGSCIGPPPSDCKPLTCAEQRLFCGPAGDGCDDGVVLDCGACFDGQYCGGNLDAGAGTSCGNGACVPRTCADANATCGTIGNGCGGALDCGTCPDGEACGGGGIANSCGIQVK